MCHNIILSLYSYQENKRKSIRNSKWGIEDSLPLSGGEYHGRGRRRKCRTSLFGSPLTEEGRARLGLREKPLRVGEYSARLRDL